MLGRGHALMCLHRGESKKTHELRHFNRIECEEFVNDIIVKRGLG